MTTTKQAILLAFLSALCTSIGQLLWKAGVGNLVPGSLGTYFNLFLLSGFLSYGIAAVLFVRALQQGNLSIVYPLLATSYVLVGLAAPLFFPAEAMNPWKWLGVFSIILSVTILGRGSSAEAGHG